MEDRHSGHPGIPQEEPGLETFCADSQVSESAVERLIPHGRALLELIGEDPDREGLMDTPKRWAKAMLELTSGYHRDPCTFTKVRFSEAYDQVVMMQGIPFYSLCEHHMLPFFGTIDVAYLPDEAVLGASKLARVADCFAQRLQVQERMTQEIAKALFEGCSQGSMVVVRARHLCMEMRGVCKAGQVFKTSDARGRFRDDMNLKSEVLSLLGDKNG